MSQFVVKRLSSQPFAYISGSSRIADMPKSMGQRFATLAALFGAAKTEPAGPPLAHFLSYDDESANFDLGFPAQPGDVEALRAAGLSIGETPSGQAMMAMHTGPYEELGDTYDAMMREMKTQHLEPTKDMWERYLSGPETPPEKAQTEVTWPVRTAD